MKSLPFILLLLLRMNAYAQPNCDTLVFHNKSVDYSPDKSAERVIDKWRTENLWKILNVPANSDCRYNECGGMHIGLTFYVDDEGKPKNISFTFYDCPGKKNDKKVIAKLLKSFGHLRFTEESRNRCHAVIYNSSYTC